MSNVTLFGGKKFNMPTMPVGYEDNTTKTLAGNSGGAGKRISIKGKAFRQIIDGEQVHVSEERYLDVVIVNAAPVARQFYEAAYDPNETTAPTCWSSDTVKPDSAVPDDQRQSPKCVTCPNNIKGSGKGESRACRFNQKIAVVLDGEFEDQHVYQLQLPATSVFGSGAGADKKLMPLQAYAKYVAANSVHVISVVTRMKMDINSEHPQLSFSPVRPLDQDELANCIEARDSEDSQNAVKTSVYQTDGGKSAPAKAPVEEEEEEAPAPRKKAAVKTPPPVEEEEDEVPAPRKKAAVKTPPPVEEEEEDEVPPSVKTKKKPTPEPAETDDDGELANLLNEWDD